MTEPAVELRGVSKRFTLRHERHRSFQELAIHAFRRRQSSEDFWALRDVSFRVEPGRSFGIVGENGSGKSTALKMIAGILRPTTGTIAVNGRLAALLELGAGFHPDLTGRENIFLNASLLGFSRREIERRLNAIVDFAELDRFIDTPLKHYSSGMSVRLGFAIAINSDPDVLITDEVLSVGDEAFQHKCIDRIDDFVRRGKTIIIVSHSLDTIRYACSEAVWIDHGQVRAAGASLDVIEQYVVFASAKDRLRRAEEERSGTTASPILGSARRWGSGEIEITSVELLDAEGRVGSDFTTGQPLTVRIRYFARERVARPLFGVSIHFGENVLLNGPNTTFAGVPIESVDGSGVVEYRVSSLTLLRGNYSVSAAAYDYHGLHAFDHHDRLYSLHVQQREIREQFGILWMPSEWSHRPGTLGEPWPAAAVIELD